MNPFQWMAVGCLYAIVLWAQAAFHGKTVWEFYDINQWEKQ